ncbi:MAG TPA: RNA methyltransferase [Thermomicrobiales bacterium]|nr:RNA methyltransferase [Thermomicrobiales bacterium]
MSDQPRSNRRWLDRVRGLRDRATREREGVCYVEGIRQVLSAQEGGHRLEAVLVDPVRLKSEVAWQAVTAARAAGAEYVALTTREFERISSRDNPVGIAAIVSWAVGDLDSLTAVPDGLYLIADDVRDPGNLGTLIRTLDAAGGQAVVVLAGTDPSHPNALRASLGTTFRVPVYRAASHEELFVWTAQHGVTTIATSAKSDHGLWQMPVRFPAAVLVGNEGDGLAAETVARCDLPVAIPMLGTATSLNVSVAAGVVLYEVRRKALGSSAISSS